MSGGARERERWRRMLTYAHVFSRMLTYVHVCSRMLTYVHVCSRMFTYAHVCEGQGGLEAFEEQRRLSFTSQNAPEVERIAEEQELHVIMQYYRCVCVYT